MSEYRLLSMKMADAARPLYTSGAPVAEAPESVSVTAVIIVQCCVGVDSLGHILFM